MSFVDPYSQFTWIYFLKTKAKALTTFQQFKSMVELQHGYPIKALHPDWGGEFRPFTNFLKDHGIIYRVIYLHTHQQSGVLERKHRHIIEIGFTFLSQATPFTCLDYSFSTPIYLTKDSLLPQYSLRCSTLSRSKHNLTTSF